MANGQPSDVEKIKASSRYLRGTIVDSLVDPLTGSVPEEDFQLLKFHGIYRQDDRDLRSERRRQKLEPAYCFMVRVRAPGGVMTSGQWLALDAVATRYAGNTLRITTRGSLQLHWIEKRHLGEVVRAINESGLTTRAACGDDLRNIAVNPNPYQSEIHAEVYSVALRLNELLKPESSAYREIFLGGDGPDSSDAEEEPIYGKTYLPRKFKIGIAIPPSNDVDVLTHDLGLIACVDGGRLQGFNVAVGGGMGMTYGDLRTYPRLAEVIGFCPLERIMDLALSVMTIQRDFGDRSERKYARLKYTIDARGSAWFIGELQERLGWELEAARPYRFEHSGDRYGWVQGSDGNWHLTLYVENGRVRDHDGSQLLTGLRELASIHRGEVRLTPNQNLVLSGVAPGDKAGIDELARTYGLHSGEQRSGLRRNSMACVAFPTCALAMAESERYLPHLLEKLEAILDEAGLLQEEIVLRMSGCPNGCARPYLAEIGFTGKAPGKYNVYLGAGFAGERMNALYLENVGEDVILAELRPIIHRYAKDREPGEHFGDFVVRAGYVSFSASSRDFHVPPAVPRSSPPMP